MNPLPEHVYLCVVEWPNGVQGLLFPRPGNVAMASQLDHAHMDFAKAQKHLLEYIKSEKAAGRDHLLLGTSIRLVKFQCSEVIAEHRHV